MSYQYPTVGASYRNSSSECTFTVWAPLKKQVELVINDKTHPLKQDERGYWSIFLKDIKPGTLYNYKLDNDKVLPDPASRWQPKGVHGPSAVVDPSFQWSDSQWKGIPLGDMIIYELHVGTFTQSSTFDGIISKLDYLKELGVNAIEIMPLAQFPGSRNWGYDGVYPFAVQDSYGGVAGLKKLVNEAHNKGIAIILDVVYNHQGPEGNYFPEFAPYFTDKYKTGWGQAINYDDAYCDGVRNYYWQNALMWLDEFHVDGLRLDAVHAIWDVSANHFIQELRKKVSELESKSGRKKVLVAEFDLNNPRYINPPSKGGYGLDGQWIDEFHHALRSVVTGDVSGYYEDFGDINLLAKAYKESYVYTGEYSTHRKKVFGAQLEGNPYSQFVVFAQNHDQIGNRLLGDRITTLLSFEALKLTAAAYILSPHVPMLFMGEEYGEKNPFQYFISHTDKALVEAVRKGRKEEFSYFKWEGEVPDPQGEDTFNKCVLSWRYDKDEEQATLLAFYKHLINFRKQRQAMQGRERNTVNVFPVENKIIGIERSHGNDYVLILLNFNKEGASFKHRINRTLKKVFDSSAKEWRGKCEAAPKQVEANQPINLSPESIVVFE